MVDWLPNKEVLMKVSEPVYDASQSDPSRERQDEIVWKVSCQGLFAA